MFPSFYDSCFNEFGFLITEHAFPAPRLMILGREVHAEFRKGEISFSITHEPPSNVWGKVVHYRDNESLRPIKEIYIHQLQNQLLNYNPDRETGENEAGSWLGRFIQYLREDQTLVMKAKVHRLASFVKENYDDILKNVTPT